MGDYNETLLELQNRQKNELYARHRLLSGCGLHLDGKSIHWILDLDHIDCFVSQSEGNASVEYVMFYPCAYNGQNDDVWDKVGQAIGNLQALGKLRFSNHTFHEDEVVRIPDWEILARILSHVRRRIALSVSNIRAWSALDTRSIAQAIRGHPSITRFEGGEAFPYEYMDAFYSALITLPSLESVHLCNNGRQAPLENESTFAHHESLTELLGVPSLRSVCFDRLSFTSALCQAAASAFMEGTTFTNLEFSECSFSTGECAAILANDFSRNTSVSMSCPMLCQRLIKRFVAL
jgi:hypothetical protein